MTEDIQRKLAIKELIRTGKKLDLTDNSELTFYQQIGEVFVDMFYELALGDITPGIYDLMNKAEEIINDSRFAEEFD